MIRLYGEAFFAYIRKIHEGILSLQLCINS